MLQAALATATGLRIDALPWTAAAIVAIGRYSQPTTSNSSSIPALPGVPSENAPGTADRTRKPADCRAPRPTEETRRRIRGRNDTTKGATIARKSSKSSQELLNSGHEGIRSSPAMVVFRIDWRKTA